VKYLYSRNGHDQELCEANCHARLKLPRKIQLLKFVVKKYSSSDISII